MFHTHPPTCRTRVSLFVCIITFHLSFLARSYSNADIALLIILPHRFPAGIQTGYQLTSVLAVPVVCCAKYKLLTSELTPVLCLAL